MLRLKTGEDGALSKDGLIAGCYVHGLFAGDAFRHAFLGRLRQREASGLRYEAMVEDILDAFADHLQAHLDIDGLLALARGEERA
jgi:adenosylcobyric acid synthase